MYIYIYIYICVRVCVWMSQLRETCQHFYRSHRVEMSMSPALNTRHRPHTEDSLHLISGILMLVWWISCFPTLFFSPLLTNLKYYVFTYDLIKSVLIWCVCLHLMSCLNYLNWICVSGDSFWDRVWMMTEENCSFDNLLGKKIHCIFLGTH